MAAHDTDNQVVADLDVPTLERIRRNSRTVRLLRGQILFEPGEQLLYVWFPTSGVISLSSITADGAAIEVAAVGSEGLVGGSAAIGGRIAPCRALVSVEGEALRMEVDAFVLALDDLRPFRSKVFACLRGVLVQLLRSTICNRFHTTEQRLSRWLLEMADRADVRRLPLTHESLALMLGIRRPWVTQVIRRLRERGCIRYQRGELVDVNRRCLQGTACECYRLVRQEVRDLN